MRLQLYLHRWLLLITDTRQGPCSQQLEDMLLDGQGRSSSIAYEQPYSPSKEEPISLGEGGGENMATNSTGQKSQMVYQCWQLISVKDKHTFSTNGTSFPCLAKTFKSSMIKGRQLCFLLMFSTCTKVNIEFHHCHRMIYKSQAQFLYKQKQHPNTRKQEKHRVMVKKIF